VAHGSERWGSRSSPHTGQALGVPVGRENDPDEAGRQRDAEFSPSVRPPIEQLEILPCRQAVHEAYD